MEDALWNCDDGGNHAPFVHPWTIAFRANRHVGINYGDGETYVAASCANYGYEAYFVSKLPKHEIGQAAVNALRRYGVHTDFVARGGNRIGVYYLETGASMHPSKVIYDRAGSPIAEALPENYDFDAIMKDADWFHWSGITPVISDASAKCLRLASIAGKSYRITEV